MADKNSFELRPYTHKELACLYGVSWATFKRWVKRFQSELGPKHGHFYSCVQVRIIVEKLGRPERM